MQKVPPPLTYGNCLQAVLPIICFSLNNGILVGGNAFTIGIVCFFVKKRTGAMRNQAQQRRVVGCIKCYVEKRTKAEARARYRSQMKQDRLQALVALPFHMLDDVPEVGKPFSDKQFLKAGRDVDLDEYFDWDHLKNNAEISPPPPVG